MKKHYGMRRLSSLLRFGKLSGFLLAILIACSAHAQSPIAAGTFGLSPGRLSVGFRLLEERDASRAVTGGLGSTSHARPIRIYLWYPTGDAPRPMSFGRYAALADGDIWPEEIAPSLRSVLTYSRRPLARSLDPEDYEALWRQPVRATENAAPLAGDYPLVVVGQGLYYESPIALAALCEFLAGRGFVVATTPLVGTNSALVRVDAEDLESVARDLEYVVGRVRQLTFVSPDRLGVLGFDQGGMAGLILAMRNPDVDAFASLDAGILYPHPSGLPVSSASYDTSALRVPWLHATPPRGVTPPPDSGVDSLMDTAVHVNRYLLVTEGIEHVDFTSYSLIEARQAMPAYWGEATPERAARHAVVAEYIHSFFAAFLKSDTDSLASLARDPEEAFPGSGMSLEHRAAVPVSIGYDELVQAVLGGRAEPAVADLRLTGARSDDLDEAHLGRLVVSLLFTWGLAEEAIPLIQYMAEQYPSSVQARTLLAEAYVLVGNYAAAIDVLSEHVRQHPDDLRALSRLEQVREIERIGDE